MGDATPGSGGLAQEAGTHSPWHRGWGTGTPLAQGWVFRLQASCIICGTLGISLLTAKG